MKTKKLLLLGLISFAMLSLYAQDFNQPHGIIPTDDIDNIATMREQVLKMEEWLKWRKENIVPEVMRRVGVDMWIVSRSDGPLYYSLAPANYEGCISQRYRLLVFYDRGEKEGIEEITSDYEGITDLVKSRNPGKIGISEASAGRVGESLGSKMASSLVTTRDLRTGFLEKRSPEELSVFEHVCRVAYTVIAEAFSNKVIIPDVTTTDDVNWWILQRYRELGVGTSDYPTITIQRSVLERPKYAEGDEHFNIEVPPRNGYNKIIRRGDLLSCDTGIDYFGLGTDTQSNAYVLLEGETDVPEGLKLAMDNTNRLQNNFAEAFEVGKPSHDIVNDALKASFEDGLRPAIYSHPIPYYLQRYSLNGGFIIPRYGAGPGLGSGEGEEPAPMMSPGGYPVYENTVYAMELHCWTDVPEWGGQKVRLVLETNVAMKKDGLVFLGGRQAEWYVIK